MKPLYIPPATCEKMLNPAKPGGRHNQMIAIALGLLGNGLHPEAVFVQLRNMFPDTGPDAVPDDEIEGIVNGAKNYDLQPSTPGYRRTERAVAKSAPSQPTIPPSQAVEAFLKGYRTSEEEIISRSPVAIPAESWQEASVFIEHLFRSDELVNLVSERFVRPDGTLSPVGYGTSRTAAKWLDLLADKQAVPQSEAGCWIRLNPTDGKGIHDARITAFRHTLVEFDEIPVELQLAFFAKARLPITALVKSGGKSVHAWVHVDAPDLAAYRAEVKALYAALECFGIDPANKNPGRLARMPGARRQDSGARNGGLQRLLYLNPKPTGKAIAETTVPTRSEIPD